MGVIDHPDKTIEVGYWFGINYQGKGYALEALRATLEQIAADPALVDVRSLPNARPDNVASIKLLTKTGFYATGRPGPRPNRIEFDVRRRRVSDPAPSACPVQLQEGCAAGHGVDAACHVAALVGREQNVDAGQFLRLAGTAERRVLPEAFHLSSGMVEG